MCKSEMQRREVICARGKIGKGSVEMARAGSVCVRAAHTLHASLKSVSPQVYNVHYSMSINGKVEEGTMEIDSAKNMERFTTGGGADEAVEVHDFEIVSPA